MGEGGLTGGPGGVREGWRTVLVLKGKRTLLLDPP